VRCGTDQTFSAKAQVILHNAQPHVAGVVNQLLARWQLGVLYHPPYSPDSTCDFGLMRNVEEPLRCRRFKTILEIIDDVGRSVRNNKTGAAKGIIRLHRWKCVLHNVGEYIKGLKI